MSKNAVVCVSLMMLLGCGGGSPDRESSLTLLIFSGQPNPTWVPANKVRSAVESALELLDASNPPSNSSDALGFSGFLYENIRYRGRLFSLTVTQERVSLAPGGGSFDDPGSTVYAVLRDEAVQHSPDLTDAIPQVGEG